MHICLAQSPTFIAEEEARGKDDNPVLGVHLRAKQTRKHVQMCKLHILMADCTNPIDHQQSNGCIGCDVFNDGIFQSNGK